MFVLASMARSVYVADAGKVGAALVAVRYALSVSNTRDKSDRKSGEKIVEIGTLLVKYVCARKKMELGSKAMSVNKFMGVVSNDKSNKTVGPNPNLNSCEFLTIGVGTVLSACTV